MGAPILREFKDFPIRLSNRNRSLDLLIHIHPQIHNGERHYLWRAVDQEGHVLDILVQRRRDTRAAKKFFRRLLKGCQYVPRVIVTDQLKSYSAAKREMLRGKAFHTWSTWDFSAPVIM
jgi:transposase-like protein